MADFLVVVLVGLGCFFLGWIVRHNSTPLEVHNTNPIVVGPDDTILIETDHLINQGMHDEIIKSCDIARSGKCSALLLHNGFRFRGVVVGGFKKTEGG